MADYDRTLTAPPEGYSPFKRVAIESQSAADQVNIKAGYNTAGAPNIWRVVRGLIRFTADVAVANRYIVLRRMIPQGEVAWGINYDSKFRSQDVAASEVCDMSFNSVHVLTTTTVQNGYTPSGLACHIGLGRDFYIIGDDLFNISIGNYQANDVFVSWAEFEYMNYRLGVLKG